MELDTYMTSVALLVVLVTSGALSEGPQQEDKIARTRLIERMDNIQRQLAEVTRTMRVLDTDIGNMLIQCLDKSGSICPTLDVHAELQTTVDGSPVWSSVKRSSTAIPQMVKNRRLYSDLSRKRALVNHLIETVKDAGQVLKNERKRTCQLNLGFHCDTQEISDFADIYDFLSSERSPGKKRSVRNVS